MVASGREMVVVSVPAEVTVILLDIEGTTTPIAFVKVRGGRERGSYSCLKASKKGIFSVAHFALESRGSGEAVWLCVSGRGWREAAGVLSLAPPSSPSPSLLSVCWRRIGESGGGLSNGSGRGGSAGWSWGDRGARGLAGRCAPYGPVVERPPRAQACGLS